MELVHATHERIVGLVEFSGSLFVGTERMVYQLKEGVLVPIMFEKPRLRVAAQSSRQEEKSKAMEAAREAVSRIGCSIAVDNDFKEGVEAAFPNCNEEMDHLEYKEAVRGKESE